MSDVAGVAVEGEGAEESTSTAKLVGRSTPRTVTRCGSGAHPVGGAEWAWTSTQSPAGEGARAGSPGGPGEGAAAQLASSRSVRGSCSTLRTDSLPTDGADDRVLSPHAGTHAGTHVSRWGNNVGESLDTCTGSPPGRQLPIAQASESAYGLHPEACLAYSRSCPPTPVGFAAPNRIRTDTHLQVPPTGNLRRLAAAAR